MLAALTQSRKALPECLLSPSVGCVIVDTQKTVAQGYRQVPGEHHAEAYALKQIQGKAFNLLRMYVTLEPCSFHGRTLTCALAIAEDCRIHEIYLSLIDPDPCNHNVNLFALIRY
ncbi:MAG: deaminase [Nostoc sp.]|uniref:deaminase n=1 Tax=Nostoc sp. TaxID=1180 RepID=UPI002FF8EA5E